MPPAARAMAGLFRALLLAAVLAAGIPSVGHAEALPPDAGPARTVKLFDVFCLALLPDLGTIAGIASQHFQEITGDELERFRLSGSDALHAWRFTEFGHDYILVTFSAPPDPGFEAEFPDFAGATSYSCSLQLPPQDPQGGVGAAMATLMQRGADEAWLEEPLKVSVWKGRTEDMLINVFHYAPANGEPGGLLTSIVFVRP